MATSIPTLHHLENSQSLRILWALEELALAKNLRYNLKTYPRHKGRAPPDLQSVFPLGKSPILQIPTTTYTYYRPLPPNLVSQDKTIVTESKLILRYLSAHYADDLWSPSSADDRDRDAYFQEFASCTLQPIVERVLIFDLITPNVPLPLKPLSWAIFTPFVRLFVKDLHAPFDLMETSLSQEKPWFAGGSLGLADFVMSWPMDLAEKRGYFDSARYPMVAGWLARVRGREGYRRAVEKGGRYDLVSF